MKQFNPNNPNYSPFIFVSCMLMYVPSIMLLLLGLHRQRNAKRHSFFLISSLDKQYNALIKESDVEISALKEQLLIRTDAIAKANKAIPDELKGMIYKLCELIKSYPRLKPQSKNYSRHEYEEIINRRTQHHKEIIEFSSMLLEQLAVLDRSEDFFIKDSSVSNGV